MSKTVNDYLAEIAQKVAESDAKADADLADILAGRPMKKKKVQTAPPAGSTEAPVAKKPRTRTRRSPSKTTS